jgi:hypothetical protein
MQIEVVTGEELEKYFSPRPEVAGTVSADEAHKDLFGPQGMVILRTVEAYQFSSTARFYFDGQKQQVMLPGVVASMFATDPVIRLRTRDSFKFVSHLRVIEPIPENMWGEIFVDPTILNIGCSVSGFLPAGFTGPVSFIFHAWRAVEIVRGYPTALLRMFKWTEEGREHVRYASSEGAPKKRTSKRKKA